jgi:hypothetical protein
LLRTIHFERAREKYENFIVAFYLEYRICVFHELSRRAFRAQTLNPNSPVRFPGSESQARQNDLSKTFDRLIEKARNSGTTRVIIGLRVANYKPEGELNSKQLKKQRAKIKQAQNALLNRLKPFRVKEIKKFDNIPFISAEVDADALTRIRKFTVIKSIEEDEALAPM